MFFHKRRARRTVAYIFLANKLGWVKTLYKSTAYQGVRLLKTGVYCLKSHRLFHATLFAPTQNNLKSLLFEGFLRKKGFRFQEEAKHELVK